MRTSSAPQTWISIGLKVEEHVTARKNGCEIKKFCRTFNQKLTKNLVLMTSLKYRIWNPCTKYDVYSTKTQGDIVVFRSMTSSNCINYSKH